MKEVRTWEAKILERREQQQTNGPDILWFFPNWGIYWFIFWPGQKTKKPSREEWKLKAEQRFYQNSDLSSAKIGVQDFKIAHNYFQENT